MRPASPLTISQFLVFPIDFTTLTPGAVSSIPGSLSFSRASTATVQTSASQITTIIPNDIARAGNDGTHAGLVFEETRTNIVTDRVITAASYHVGSGDTSTGSQVSPDGSGQGVRVQVTSGGNSRYMNPVIAVGHNFVCSSWQVQSIPGGLFQFVGFANSGTADHTYAVGGTAPASYTRYVASGMVATVNTNAIVPAYGIDETTALLHAGIVAGARDVIVDCQQCEDNSMWASEYIPTSGGTATRAGERLFYPNGATWIDKGRLSIYVSLEPKGSSSQYVNNMRIASFDALNYCGVNAISHAIECVVGGVMYTTPLALSWAAGDLLEIWIEFGGGVLATKVEYRVNGGSWTIVSTGLPPTQAAIVATGAIDLFCSGTTLQFSAWLRGIQVFQSGHHFPGIA